ncbi:MAG TPA: hypothetical protein VHL31_13250 [Geminicoccus sp.]|uniref:hypothetical protein n=1 Tax=Geminicoccus sp. TaxID=2024832 RepID=UPI002E2FFEE6|nr:hypothetical protein [Geminicoccus sp.]HEX2527248.1 hypothetical protein [Geminicoccus sp.]
MSAVQALLPMHRVSIEQPVYPPLVSSMPCFSSSGTGRPFAIPEKLSGIFGPGPSSDLIQGDPPGAARANRAADGIERSSPCLSGDDCPGPAHPRAAGSQSAPAATCLLLHRGQQDKERPPAMVGFAGIRLLFCAVRPSGGCWIAWA